MKCSDSIFQTYTEIREAEKVARARLQELRRKHERVGEQAKAETIEKTMQERLAAIRAAVAPVREEIEQAERAIDALVKLGNTLWDAYQQADSQEIRQEVERAQQERTNT